MTKTVSFLPRSSGRSRSHGQREKEKPLLLQRGTEGGHRKEGRKEGRREGELSHTREGDYKPARKIAPGRARPGGRHPRGLLTAGRKGEGMTVILFALLKFILGRT